MILSEDCRSNPVYSRERAQFETERSSFHSSFFYYFGFFLLRELFNYISIAVLLPYYNNRLEFWEKSLEAVSLISRRSVHHAHISRRRFGSIIRQCQGCKQHFRKSIHL